MKSLADGVVQLRLFPPNAINVYLVNGVLVDAATRFEGGLILRQLRDQQVTGHVLTHAHPDHQGASARVCRELRIPFMVGERDVAAAEDPRLIGERQPDHWIAQFMHKALTGPGHHVDRVLHEDDEVAGFQVLDVPGHSAGHIALWRESDRTLILGDVLNGRDPLTGMPGLREPKWFFTPDPAENRRSAKRLGMLEPRLVCFGHGAPLRDTRKFVDFCAALADS